MTPAEHRAQLTADQKMAADAFFDFLLSDDQVFVLSGGAGVGKTFLMKYLSNSLMTVYENSCRMLNVDPKEYEVHYTATTNKAAEVLEHAVQASVGTIHSFLGLRVWDDYKTGKSVISETNNSRVWRNIILFIDESSMIDSVLYKQILKRVVNSKIVFVGDKAQLAPVDEDLSLVYKDVDPKNFVHLTQAVRNANTPALMSLCAQLRHTVTTGEFFRIVPDGMAIEHLNDERMQEELKRHFLDPEKDDARILCYTNSRVAAYNEYIREIRNLPPEIIAGDHLVVARAYASGKQRLPVEREVTVLSVDPEIRKAGYQDATPDKKEILYRNIVVQPRASFMEEIQIPVPLDFEQVNQTIKTLKRRKEYGRYFELKNGYADLRGKEACTVYKSQGSTYHTVFIDIGNIGCSFDREQVARMLFVGASRATTKVFLYGELPPKYLGKSVYDPTSHTPVAAE